MEILQLIIFGIACFGIGATVVIWYLKSVIETTFDLLEFTKFLTPCEVHERYEHTNAHIVPSIKFFENVLKAGEGSQMLVSKEIDGCSCSGCTHAFAHSFNKRRRRKKHSLVPSVQWDEGLKPA